MYNIYKDIDGDLDVYQYEIGDDYISVIFNNSSHPYKYSYAKTGKYHVEKMKDLAK